MSKIVRSLHVNMHLNDPYLYYYLYIIKVIKHPFQVVVYIYLKWFDSFAISFHCDHSSFVCLLRIRLWRLSFGSKHLANGKRTLTKKKHTHDSSCNNKNNSNWQRNSVYVHGKKPRITVQNLTVAMALTVFDWIVANANFRFETKINICIVFLLAPQHNCKAIAISQPYRIG